MTIFINNCLFRKFQCRDGMTLPEVLVAAALLTVVMTGILLSYLQAVELQETAEATSLATRVAMSRIEQIRSTTFSQIKPMYHQVAFAIPGLNGIGVSYIDNSNSELLVVTISASWRQKSGRVYGEDKNLNGIINTGEDLNGNNQLDSVVQLVTKVLKK